MVDETRACLMRCVVLGMIGGMSVAGIAIGMVYLVVGLAVVAEWCEVVIRRR